MIIGLVGHERVGKDAFADILVSKYGFKKHSMADPIREIAYKIFPHWDMPDTNKDDIDKLSGIRPRDFMKWLGTDIFQLAFHQRFPDTTIDNKSIWSSICAKRILSDTENQTNWVIPDIRFKHEAEQIHQLGGIFINLISDNNSSGQSQYDIPYILDNYPFTQLMNNKSNGINGLEALVDTIIGQLNSSYLPVTLKIST